MDINEVIDPMHLCDNFTWFWGYIRLKDKGDVSAEELQEAIATLKEEYTIDIDDKYKDTPEDIVNAASADLFNALIGGDHTFIGDFDEEDENKLYVDQRGEMQWNTPYIFTNCLIDSKLVEEINLIWVSDNMADYDDMHGTFLASRLVYDDKTDSDIREEDLKLTAE